MSTTGKKDIKDRCCSWSGNSLTLLAFRVFAPIIAVIGPENSPKANQSPRIVTNDLLTNHWRPVTWSVNVSASDHMHASWKPLVDEVYNPSKISDYRCAVTAAAIAVRLNLLDNVVSRTVREQLVAIVGVPTSVKVSQSNYLAHQYPRN